MKRSLIFAVALSIAMPIAAFAQTQRSGDTNARVMQQLQQVTGERMQLKAENDKLKQELEQTKKQLSTATAEQNSLQAKLKAAEGNAARDAASTQQNAEALEKLRAQAQELVTRFRETAQTLKEVETDRNNLKSKFEASQREVAACIDRNLDLYKLNSEVLDRYEKKGVFTSLAEKEPFTRIQRTRLENLIDGYRERAAELKINNPSKQ